jgi:3-dehydroquinate dehydratase II
VAILDALKMFSGIKIEVHLSNTNLREEFRKIKITAQGSDAVLEGLGKFAYIMGVRAAIARKEL